MQYNKIRKMDISNGPGVRVSIFLQGCVFHCEECFNPETWDFDGGKEFNDEIIDHVLNLCEASHIKGLSILGGEPLHPRNIEGSTMLAKKFRERFPDKSLWLWSGYNFEEYISKQEIVNYLDVVVDGQFQIQNKDPRLKYRGSTNQRVIDIKKSKETGKTEFYED